MDTTTAISLITAAGTGGYAIGAKASLKRQQEAKVKRKQDAKARNNQKEGKR